MYKYNIHDLREGSQKKEIGRKENEDLDSHPIHSSNKTSLKLIADHEWWSDHENKGSQTKELYFTASCKKKHG